jgi:hypothetical protein
MTIVLNGMRTTHLSLDSTYISFLKVGASEKVGVSGR